MLETIVVMINDALSLALPRVTLTVTQVTELVEKQHIVFNIIKKLGLIFVTIMIAKIVMNSSDRNISNI